MTTRLVHLIINIKTLMFFTLKFIQIHFYLYGNVADLAEERPTSANWFHQNAYYWHICILIALLMVPMEPLNWAVHWFGVFGSLWEQIWKKLPLYCSENQVLMQFSVSYFNFSPKIPPKHPNNDLPYQVALCVTLKGLWGIKYAHSMHFGGAN